MCIAIPGKIVAINDNLATIEYHDQNRSAKIVSGNYRIGNYVIVQAGLVIDKVPEIQMKTWLKFLQSK